MRDTFFTSQLAGLKLFDYDYYKLIINPFSRSVAELSKNSTKITIVLTKNS